jgi:hypothetical protein
MKWVDKQTQSRKESNTHTHTHTHGSIHIHIKQQNGRNYHILFNIYMEC